MFFGLTRCLRTERLVTTRRWKSYRSGLRGAGTSQFPLFGKSGPARQAVEWQAREVPPVQRRSVRVLPVDRDGQVLLLLGHDPARPSAPYWFTIGGGVETGETAEEAAVREMLEETGIRVETSQLVGPFHRGTHTFSFAGVDYVSDSTFFAVRVDDVIVTFDGLEDCEIGNIFDARWWAPDDLATGASLSNLDLPAISRAAVAALTRATENPSEV